MTVIKIHSVQALEKYKLQLLFSDGTAGVYDAGHLAGKGVFSSWDINDNFNNVFIHPESGAISWPGDIDIDSINLYCTIKGIKVDSFLLSQQHATHM